MTKNWMGLGLAALALAASVSAGFACEKHAEAAKPKDAKETTDAKEAMDTKTVAANDHASGCDMPCCAQAKAAADDNHAANAAGEKPCAAGNAKGCPKKAATAAKAEPAKDTAQAQPAADPGTHR